MSGCVNSPGVVGCSASQVGPNLGVCVASTLFTVFFPTIFFFNCVDYNWLIAQSEPTMAPLAVTALCILLGSALSAATTFEAQVNNATGAYSLRVDGVEWYSSDAKSGGIGLLVGGAAQTLANGGMQLTRVTSISGTSPLGAYTGTQLQYSSTAGGVVYARFKASALPSGAAAILCELEITNGLAGSGKSVKTGATDLTAGFPVFSGAPAQSSTSKGYITWLGDFAGGHVGVWDSDTSTPLGNQGGPVATFNTSSLLTVVASSASHFMVGGLAFPSWAGPKSLSGGLFAALTGVPARTVHSTILVAGPGIADTMRAWGGALLTLGGKAPTALQRDPQTAYLAYYTDNGPWNRYGRHLCRVWCDKTLLRIVCTLVSISYLYRV